MPNGHDRNFVRLCRAIDHFRAKHGAWPTHARVDPGVLEDLLALFDEESRERLRTRFPLIPARDAMIAACDDRGRTWDAGHETVGSIEHRPRAREWLGIHTLPDPEHETDEEETGLLWSNCVMDSAFYDKTPADEGVPCEVRIDDDAIVLSYEADGLGRVVYQGSNDGTGHFQLRSAETGGRGTLHRFPDGRVLEGSWEEDGTRGFWRILLRK